MSATIPEAAPVRSARRKLATGTNPYIPAPARIMRVRELATEVRLYDLRFTDSALADSFNFRPGQFVELSVLGVGEGPFSLPSSPTRRGVFQLGIRRTGSLTNYLFDHITEGDEVGIRGPLGNGFPVEMFEGQDMLLVAGGLGMVPLRGLLQYLIDQRDRFGKRDAALRHTLTRAGAVPRRAGVALAARRRRDPAFGGRHPGQAVGGQGRGGHGAPRPRGARRLAHLRRRLRAAGVLQVHAGKARGGWGFGQPPDLPQPGAPYGVRGRKVRPLRGRLHLHLPARAGVLVLGRASTCPS